MSGRDTRVAVKLVLPTDTAGNADVGGAARREVAALAHATRHVPAAVLQLRGFVHAGSFLIAQEMPGTSLIKHVEKVMNEQGGLKASTWVRPPPWHHACHSCIPTITPQPMHVQACPQC